MKTRKIRLIILCFIIILAATINIYGKEINTKDYENANIMDPDYVNKAILGFWNFGFPVSSGTWGYGFLDNGKFIYYNGSDNGYFGTLGKWKQVKYRIYLWPEKNIYKNKDESLYAVKANYNDWQLVSDIRSYDRYWFPSEENESYYPVSISIKEFVDGKVTPYVQRYFKLGDLESARKDYQSLFERFDNNNIKTNNENLYSIKVGNSFLKPGDYEKNINLFGLLGKPINEEYCKSISPDYPLGIEYRTLFYDGIRIDFYKSKNGLYKICGINVWNNKYPTSLGIKLGDNLTKLKTVYPNLEVDYNIYFIHENNLFLRFHVLDDIGMIELYSEERD